MKKLFRVLLFAGVLLTGITGSVARAAPSGVEVLSVDGTIVPVIGDYIDRGITQAEQDNASVCVIELNTPGGLLDTTEKIVQRILNASVPVVVYVTPKGSWAASAGKICSMQRPPDCNPPFPRT